MTDKIIENNQVDNHGKNRHPGLHSAIEVFGEGFYMVDVLVKRLSDSDGPDPGHDLGASCGCERGL